MNHKIDWLSPRGHRESLDILDSLSRTCAQLGGSLSKRLYSLVESGNYVGLVEFSFNESYSAVSSNRTSPIKWDDVRDLEMARQIQAFYSKSEWLEIGYDKKGSAISKFHEAEALCKATNAFFRHKRSLSVHSVYEKEVDPVLHGASRKIAQILGRIPPLNSLAMCYGPGANTNVKSATACPRAKLSAALACSHELSPSVAELLEEFPHIANLHSLYQSEEAWCCEVQVHPGKVMFVPKNCKTLRSICVEPVLNGLAQKGIGSYMRARLRQFGLDLSTQEFNRNAAREGSVTGELATIDLSMASDCVARELVYELLPVDWAMFLDRFITRSVIVDGKEVQLEKFSSMGNGFTFELESLIFWALALAAADLLHYPSNRVLAYGDDIIVPTRCYQLLTRVLSACGFVVNDDKSFCTGHFRESCGSDYLYGFDIRPFYLKAKVNDESLYVMHNNFIRKGEFELAQQVKELCHQDILLTGPDGYGDGHLIGSYQIHRSRKIRRLGYEGGIFYSYARRGKAFKKPLPGDAILPVYSVYIRSGSEGPTDPDVVRGSVGYEKISIYTLREDIFPRKL